MGSMFVDYQNFTGRLDVTSWVTVFMQIDTFICYMCKFVKYLLIMLTIKIHEDSSPTNNDYLNMSLNEL